jgi:hypothetical protein
MTAGCAQHSDRAKDPLVNAYKLLDQGRSAEAVALLEQLHSENPNDKKTTVILASAYASLAGLQVYSFYDLFYDAMFSRPWVELTKTKTKTMDMPTLNIPSPDELKKKTPSEVMNIVLQNFVKALGALSQISNILEKIPSLTAETKPYLEQAIILLDSIDKPEKAHAVFRALLRATYLKNMIATELSPDSTSDIVNYDSTGHCHFRPEMLSRGITEVGKIAGKLMNDLSIGFPKDKPTFVEAQATVNATMQTVSATIDSFSTLKDQKEIGQSLDQIWGCGG